MTIKGVKGGDRVRGGKMQVEMMEKCAICGKTGVSLLFTSHKELGYVGVCRDCWVKLFDDNLMVSGSGSSGGCSCGSCG
jgi:hypothetical protein